jgi:hypothetical protein
VQSMPDSHPKKAERLKQLKELAGSMSAPGSDEEKTWVDKAKSVGLTGLQGVNKASSLLWDTTTGPIVAGLLENATGKTVTTPEEDAAAINPLTLQTGASLNQMLERAGVPEGAKLSDYVQGYKESGKGAWYEPEKGGMLDPTVRGAGATVAQALLDPSTYLTMGSTAAAKAASKTSSAKVLNQVAKKGLVGRSEQALGALSDALSYVPKKVAQGVEALPGGKYSSVMFNPMGTAMTSGTKALGRAMYKAPVLPVEFAGEIYNKSGIANDLYQAGIRTPFKIVNKTEGAKKALMEARDELFNKADAMGARGQMTRATEPGFKAIQDIIEKSSKQEYQNLADTLRSGLGEYVDLEKGVPAVPPKYVPDPMSLEGKSKMLSPGSPGVAPLPTTLRRLSNEKEVLYGELPQSAYNEALKTTAGNRVKKAIAKGLKQEAERVADTVSAAGTLSDLNRAYGGMAGTTQALRGVQRRATQKAYNLLPGQADDALRGTVAATAGSPQGMTLSYLFGKGLQGLNTVTMPSGYYMRAAMEDPVLAALLSGTVKTKAQEKIGPTSGPTKWEQLQEALYKAERKKR